MKVLQEVTVVSDLAIPNEVYEKLEAAANRDARPVEHIINVALRTYTEKRSK